MNKGEELYQNMLAKGSYCVENRTAFPQRAAKAKTEVPPLSVLMKGSWPLTRRNTFLFLSLAWDACGSLITIIRNS